MLFAWLLVHFVQILGALAAAALLLLGVRRYLRARAGFRSKPWCLRCRYPCHDLPEARCPECGRPVAAELGPVWWCRRDACTILLLALAANAAVVALRNPHIESLYHLLPDRTIATLQAGEGPLAAALLPEFYRRLGGPDGPSLSELTVAGWLKRRHAASPIASMQWLDTGRQVRVGFRQLPKPPAPVDRAVQRSRLKVLIAHGELEKTLLHAEVSEIIDGHSGSLAQGPLALDIPGEEAPAKLEITVEQDRRTATQFTDTIGHVKPVEAEPAATDVQPDVGVSLRVREYWVYDAGYAVIVSGAPADDPGSDAYDVVVPWYGGGQHRMRFLGWEWLSGGVHSFVEGDPSESEIDVVIRR